MSREVEYEEDKMKKFVKQDLLLARMHSHLKENEDSLEIIFYSEVFGDSAMEEEYRKL